MGEDREHRVTRGAPEPPDGETTQADTDVMRVAGQAATIATRRLVGELKADGQDHIPTDLVVAQEASDVESSLRVDFLLLHNLRTRFVA